MNNATTNCPMSSKTTQVKYSYADDTYSDQSRRRYLGLTLPYTATSDNSRRRRRKTSRKISPFLFQTPNHQHVLLTHNTILQQRINKLLHLRHPEQRSKAHTAPPQETPATMMKNYRSKTTDVHKSPNQIQSRNTSSKLHNSATIIKFLFTDRHHSRLRSTQATRR